eukprot:766065-Hanusia_phi.AAC.3
MEEPEEGQHDQSMKLADSSVGAAMSWFADNDREDLCEDWVASFVQQSIEDDESELEYGSRRWS